MNVVHVTLKIGIVTNGMLPVATLPNSFVSLRNLARGTRPRGGQATREAGLYQAPARRKVGVIFRKRPYSMKVVWQNANGDRFKRVAALDKRVCGTKQIDVPHECIA